LVKADGVFALSSVGLETASDLHAGATHVSVLLVCEHGIRAFAGMTPATAVARFRMRLVDSTSQKSTLLQRIKISHHGKRDFACGNARLKSLF
jgi:hypothetical protein